MMWFKQFFTVYLLSMLISVNSKKAKILKTSEELLEKESQRLEKEKVKCGIDTHGAKFPYLIEHYRLTGKCVKAVPCLISKLKEDNQDGWLWSTLGSCYKDLGVVPSLINNSFKQASKLSGRISPYFTLWHYVAPFSVGKTEFDGDPIGGIHKAANYRYAKASKFYSELISGSEVKWMKIKQSHAEENIKITPNVNWQELINSMGSLALTEWQGWAVSDFAVNEDNMNIVFQCLGVHTMYIDFRPVTGDVYRRNHFQFSVALAKGIHTIYVKLRAQGTQVFQCNVDIAPQPSWDVLPITILPDLYDGNLVGRFVSIPIMNMHSVKWLEVKKISVTSQSSGEEVLDCELVKTSKTIPIAPGQVRPVIVQMTSSSSKISSACNDVTLVFSVLTSDGQKSVSSKLRCRRLDQSFIFTFVDHDGSVQHAAAVYPRSACSGRLCSIVLSLHGTSVPVQNQADSYKHMVDGEYVFGVEGAWLLAPTRHGAHNWEGPGALTAMSAANALETLTGHADFIKDKATRKAIIFAGHSMGGHGAWHLATHFPDRALAVISLAGWIKKEEYGDSNLFFKHDVSTSSVDPMTKAVMEMCIAENDADRLSSNLKDIPILTRIGSNDRTVHPYFTRRMQRVLIEQKANVTYSELPGKEHWWWDTWLTNDGGAVNDPSLRSFTAEYSTIPDDLAACIRGDDICQKEKPSSKYSATINDLKEFTLTVMNPAFGESLHGVRILQQSIPYRTSKIQVKVDGENAVVDTVNVASFSLRYAGTQPVRWNDRNLLIDGDPLSGQFGVFSKSIEGVWQPAEQIKGRTPVNMGPARRVAEKPFIIVIGTLLNPDVDQVLLESAIYISNLFYLTSDAHVPIVKDRDCTSELIESNNLVLLGSPEENSLTQQFLENVPLKHNNKGIRLGSCKFNQNRTGALFLAPNHSDKLALILLGNSISGFRDIVSLASPTIPPMTRSPFSNLVPDFVITGPDFVSRGPGGYLCTGFWGNNWDYKQELISCACS
ncbi:uncharacterized protein LOC141913023 isoform X2 [Tubulanus polymorphus]|uniref:uncharacterized protein LOC141913023 isoform X2 n=1 Tax=Tubulanus polymorphus TaxID=672921 RepID=UPI003DA56397